MRRSNVKQAVFLGAILALVSSFAPAQGAFIATETSSVNQLAGGQFLYSYTVSVASTSTVSASEVDLSLVGAINTGSIINPSNFISVYSPPGDPTISSSISFYATNDGTMDPNSIGISPGSSGTFSFTSMFAPVSGSFQALGFDSASGTISTIQGSAMVPGVPEPSSLLMSGLGICGALGLLVRSRRPTV